MPPPVEGLRVTVPALCFCGRKSNMGSLYCSPDCAREDAFNSLILGKPHQGSNKPAPLPTLPPGFFDLPPRRGEMNLSMDEADEFFNVPTFVVDHGPFQSKPKSSANRTLSKRPTPRSTLRSPASNTTLKKPKSKWRSHYQQTQEREKQQPSDNLSLEVPTFLVDTMASEEEQTVEAVQANRTTNDNDGGLLLTPTPLVPDDGQRETGSVPRTGSFGTISFPTPAALTPTLTASFDNRSSTSSSSIVKRSSSSSYVSQSTSNTGTSRTSATSFNTGPSPTKSEYDLSTVEARPRYGSAFGSVETSNIVQLAIDLRESILLAKRESRRRSNTDATILKTDEMSLPFEPVVSKKETPKTASSTNPLSPSSRTPSPTKRKIGGTPISKSQWSQFAVPISRSGSSHTILPSSRQQLTSSPPPQPVPGTVVKKTTVSTKARLPIGTSLQSIKTPPKVPSNTPSSAFNVALGAKTYLAPAYAMSVPKIPTSTRTLHTSPSDHSLKAKKSEGRIRIPSMNTEERTSLIERLKKVVNGDVSPSTTPNTTPRAESKAFQLTLKLDALKLQNEKEDGSAITPNLLSANGTPSTSGGPPTPRPSAQENNRPFWMTSPAKSNTSTVQDHSLLRENRLGSEASAASGLSFSSSSSSELTQATLCIAQRMMIQSSPLSTVPNSPLIL